MTKKTVKNTKKVSKTVKKTVKVAVKANEVRQMDLHQAFDLTDVSRETLESYTWYLKEMVNSAGWKLMCQVLQGNLALLEKQIVRKKEILTDRPLTDEEVDSLRDQHQILEELLNKPQELITKYEKKPEPSMVTEYDPYGGDRHSINAATMRDTT